MVPKKVVELKDVWVAYNGDFVLEGIDFAIYENDLVSIIGPNGSGKTTLLKVITGLLSPARGFVQVFGENPEKAKSLIGYVPQHCPLDDYFPISVFEVVIMGRLGRAGLGRRFTQEDREKAFLALKRVSAEGLKDRPIGSLSLGQRQRVFIARALAAEPKLLLLDEPTASVDTPGQADFYEMLKDLKQKMAIVLITHDISVVSAHVEKIVCLNRRIFHCHTREVNQADLKALYQRPVGIINHRAFH